jgi:GNAT superfamily N-acetyltransferase
MDSTTPFRTGKFESSGLQFQVTDRSDDGVLDAFYPAYDAAFVLDSEKERVEGFHDCLALNSGPTHQALRDQYGPFRELVLVARDAPTGPVLGGANFLVVQLPAERSAAVRHTINLNYLFVEPNQRGRGLSLRIMQACFRLASDLARSWHGGSGGTDGLAFLEVNDPFRLTPQQYRIDSDHSGIDQVARLAYWARAGAAILDLAYVQPALSADQVDDDTLALALIGSRDNALPARTVCQHLERFFAISVLKGEPIESSPSAAVQLARLRSEVSAERRIGLLDLNRGLPRLAQQLGRSQPGRPASLPAALAEPAP